MKLHVIRNLGISRTKKILIKVASIVLCFILAGLISEILFPGTFFSYFENVIYGTIISQNPQGQGSLTLTFLKDISVYILIAIALLPSFKMKFWNIGAEGQMMAGVIAVAVLMKYAGPGLTESGLHWLLYILYFVAGIAAGALWGFLPGYFRAKFKTNETLFTLMLNYIASLLAAYIIYTWNPLKGTINQFPDDYYLPDLFNQPYLWIVAFAIIVTVFMAIYVKYTKHGFELSVVGESDRTAKYVGMNRKAIITRTATLSGALCGLVGVLLIAATYSQFSSDITGGKGFTGVLIAWLGHFDPIQIVLYSFLVAFVTKGSTAAGSVFQTGGPFSSIIIGVFFLVLVASEFFTEFKIVKVQHFKDDKDDAINEETPKKIANDMEKGK